MYHNKRASIVASYRYLDDDTDGEPVWKLWRNGEATLTLLLQIEIIYEHVPEIEREGYITITVRYHNYTNRVMFVDYQRENSETILRTFFTYRNVKHMRCVTFKVSA